MKLRLLAFPLSAILASSAMAGTFTWTGSANNNWSDPANWTLSDSPGAILPPSSYPVPGSTYSDALTIRNNGDLTADPAGVTPGFGAVYDPGPGITTLFNLTASRGLAIGIGNGPGATPPNVKGRADLTILSGTLKINRATNSGSEPFMANRADANLHINGGHLDLSGHVNNFRLIQEGFPGLTSTITVTNGSLTCNLLDLYFDSADEDPADRFGTGIINLDGGVLALNRFNLTNPAPAGQSSFKINLNGGILRARNTNANFLPDLPDTQVIVKSGGAIVDTNTFNSTIAAPLLHDPDLGASLDGGLTKNGAGTLTLNGSSTFNGGVSVNQGRVILAASDSSAGTGTITLANTATELQIGAGRNFANPIVVADTGDLKTLLFVNTPGSTLSGPITINESTQGNFRIQVNSDNFLTIDGKITGTGGAGIQKVNPGWLNLRNADNDFTGGIQITGGILNFDNGGLGTGGNITMDGGSLRWRPGFASEDVSSRLVMVAGKAATLITGDETTSVTFSQPIGNNSSASLVKQGGGILTLTGANSYTGTTTISGGTLRVNGSLNAASAVTVTGGNLGGTGTIGGSVTVGEAGNIDPGAPAGTLNIGGNLDAAAMADGAGQFKFELAANTASSDQLAVTGTLSIGTGALGLDDFEFTNLGSLQAGTYTLITSSGIIGTLDSNNLSGPIATGFDGSLQPNGNNLELVVTATTAASAYDTWASQITNGLNLRTDDADGDGLSNLQEFLFGTSPISSNGSLVTATSSGENLTLRWLQRESGASYTLKQSPSLAEGSWTAVASPLPALDGDQSGAPTDYDYHSVTLPISDGKLFFRVEGVEN
jgi:autotransporter-associated beta strand protein